MPFPTQRRGFLQTVQQFWCGCSGLLLQDGVTASSFDSIPFPLTYFNLHLSERKYSKTFSGGGWRVLIMDHLFLFVL